MELTPENFACGLVHVTRTYSGTSTGKIGYELSWHHKDVNFQNKFSSKVCSLLIVGVVLAK